MCLFITAAVTLGVSNNVIVHVHGDGAGGSEDDVVALYQYAVGASALVVNNDTVVAAWCGNGVEYACGTVLTAAPPETSGGTSDGSSVKAGTVRFQAPWPHPGNCGTFLTTPTCRRSSSLGVRRVTCSVWQARVAAWSQWYACEGRCGEGVQRRNRSAAVAIVDNDPVPGHATAYCMAIEETRACELRECEAPPLDPGLVKFLIFVGVLGGCLCLAPCFFFAIRGCDLGRGKVKGAAAPARQSEASLAEDMRTGPSAGRRNWRHTTREQAYRQQQRQQQQHDVELAPVQEGAPTARTDGDNSQRVRQLPAVAAARRQRQRERGQRVQQHNSNRAHRSGSRSRPRPQRHVQQQQEERGAMMIEGGDGDPDLESSGDEVDTGGTGAGAQRAGAGAVPSHRRNSVGSVVTVASTAITGRTPRTTAR